MISFVKQNKGGHMKSHKSKRFTFIADGRHFTSMDEVETHAEKLGLRVTNTETINRKKLVIHLITLTK